MASSAEKRPASNSFGSSQLVKRQRSDADMGNTSAVAVTSGGGNNGTLVHGGSRAGGLPSSVMELSGHTGEVFAARFDPTGELIASGSMDRSIMLWRSNGNCDNYGVLNGHKGAILDLHWSRDSKTVFSASADTTLASWDLETGERIKKHVGHEQIINSFQVSRRGEEMLVSGSDDGYIGIWDPRQKAAVDFLETSFPVTAIAIAEAGGEIYSGGIDNEIHVWDLRKKAIAYSLSGHTDTIASLQVSPDSQTLLSNSHDSTVRTWDIRPFAPADRSLQIYDGAPTGIEPNLLKASWDPTGQRIAAGGGDGSVVIWNTRTAKLLNRLPGHIGAVNDVRFNPQNEALILSGSSDAKILLGEIAQ